MKIAIQGHPTRGEEVVQILESLGGMNIKNFYGVCDNAYYYVDCYDKIIYATQSDLLLKELKCYTLEEFEKEFLFKIGDKIKHITSIGIIKGYCYIDNEPAYKVESMELSIIATIPAKLLEPYKKMEIRNITLTLEKAKEWYKKGGELKEVALQAYSEEELSKVELPKTWEEFCNSYPNTNNEAYISFSSNICLYKSDYKRNAIIDRNICPSKKSAEAHLAMIQLEQLRDCWRQGWLPTHKEFSYSIKIGSAGLQVYCFNTVEFLSFPTREMAEEFLKCFRNLIEKAGDLI